MTNYDHGRQAEEAAAAHLVRQGYIVLQQNWRTRYCEIDIVAQKDTHTVYLMEVKYRKTSNQGSGLDYITAKKLQQMTFAAELWVSEHDWPGDYCLGAIEVSGPEFVVTDVLTDL